MQIRRAASIAGFVAGATMAGALLQAQQLPASGAPIDQQPAQSFTQPPDIDLLETFDALKQNMLEESGARLADLMRKTAPDATQMIRGTNTVCTMIVVQVDSSLDPEFVKEAATGAAATKMPVVQPFCQPTTIRKSR